MFDRISSWFSSSKQEQAAPATWDATTGTVQNQQPTSPDAPSTERIVTEQPVCYSLTSLQKASLC